MTNTQTQACVDTGSLRSMIESIAATNQMIEDRRGHARYWLGLRVTISVETPKGDLVQLTDAWGADISMGGVGLVMDTGPKRDEVLYVGLEHVLKRPVFIKACVARVQKILPRAFYIGAAFVDLPSKQSPDA